MSDVKHYRLTLTPLPWRYPDPEPPVRLRRLLKALLRGYGFRVVRVEELPTTTPASASNDGAGGVTK